MSGSLSKGTTKQECHPEIEVINGILIITFEGSTLRQVRLRPYVILDQAQPNFLDPAGDGAAVLKQVRAGVYTAQDLKDFSEMGKGGASIAPINAQAKGGVPAKVVAKVRALQAKIKSGAFRVDIDEAQPSGSISVKGK